MFAQSKRYKLDHPNLELAKNVGSKAKSKAKQGWRTRSEGQRANVNMYWMKKGSPLFSLKHNTLSDLFWERRGEGRDKSQSVLNRETFSKIY